MLRCVSTQKEGLNAQEKMQKKKEFHIVDLVTGKNKGKISSYLSPIVFVVSLLFVIYFFIIYLFFVIISTKLLFDKYEFMKVLFALLIIPVGLVITVVFGIAHADIYIPVEKDEIKSLWINNSVLKNMMKVGMVFFVIYNALCVYTFVSYMQENQDVSLYSFVRNVLYFSLDRFQ